MRRNKYVPYPVISKAIKNFEYDAVEEILKHYDKYINKLATTKLVDDNGNTFYYVDSQEKGRLQNKLLLSMTKFDLNRYS